MVRPRTAGEGGWARLYSGLSHINRGSRFELRVSRVSPIADRFTLERQTSNLEPANRLPAMTSIKVPPLGESIVEATVSRWLKKEGDAVEPGDTLVELETDKITVEVPAMSRGVLAKRLKTEGAVVKVDEVLAEL